MSYCVLNFNILNTIKKLIKMSLNQAIEFSMQNSLQD